MKTIYGLSLLLTLTSCAADIPRELSQTSGADGLKEFTGEAAEDIIASLESLGIKPNSTNLQPIHGFTFNAIDCTLVPSPRATAVCTLWQGSTSYDAGTQGEVIYQNFIRNGAIFENVGGVTKLSLSEVTCERYNVYRGVSKCFFKQP
jgi:hypothetical protein